MNAISSTYSIHFVRIVSSIRTKIARNQIKRHSNEMICILHNLEYGRSVDATLTHFIANFFHKMWIEIDLNAQLDKHSYEKTLPSSYFFQQICF